MDEKMRREMIVLSRIAPTKRLKIDNYEYESVAEMIEDRTLDYNDVKDVFGDKAFTRWFFTKHGIRLTEQERMLI